MGGSLISRQGVRQGANEHTGVLILHSWQDYSDSLDPHLRDPRWSVEGRWIKPGRDVRCRPSSLTAPRMCESKWSRLIYVNDQRYLTEATQG